MGDKSENNKIEFKYNEKGELLSYKDGKCIGKIDQTAKWLFPNAFKSKIK